MKDEMRGYLRSSRAGKYSFRFVPFFFCDRSALTGLLNKVWGVVDFSRYWAASCKISKFELRADGIKYHKNMESFFERIFNIIRI